MTLDNPSPDDDITRRRQKEDKDTVRLDKYLVEAGFVSSRTLAAKLIAARDVQVNGKVARKASMLVGPEDTLYVRQSELTEYVSRAGHKLAGALDAFPDIEVEGKRCLDAGASTGGFTDVLLRRGAAHVAAVDVGHGQLVDAPTRRTASRRVRRTQRSLYEARRHWWAGRTDGF